MQIVNVFVRPSSVLCSSQNKIYVYVCNFRQSSWTTIEPVWKELAESFEGSDEMIIASVDCKKYKDLCKTHKVSIINP